MIEACKARVAKSRYVLYIILLETGVKGYAREIIVSLTFISYQNQWLQQLLKLVEVLKRELLLRYEKTNN